MYQYSLNHEEEVLNRISQSKVTEGFLAYHNLQLSWLQRERINKLLVALVTGVFFLLSMLITKHIAMTLLCITFMTISISSITQYIKLGRKAKYWRKLSTQLCEIINRARNKENDSE